MKHTKKIVATLLSLVMVLTLLPTSAAVNFGDIRGHWAESLIKTFADKGYVNGRDDTHFAPDENMLRSEFAALALRTFPELATLPTLEPATKTQDVGYSVWEALENLEAPQSAVTDIDSAKSFILAEVKKVIEERSAELDVTLADIEDDGEDAFLAAQAGTESSPAGTNGHYNYYLNTSDNWDMHSTLTITATAYTPTVTETAAPTSPTADPSGPTATTDPTEPTATTEPTSPTATTSPTSPTATTDPTAPTATATTSPATVTPTATPVGTFKDVKANHWAFNAIETIAKVGIVEGFEDGEFRPDLKISRQDAAVIIDRILLSLNVSLYVEGVGTVTDANTISPYAQVAVLLLVKNGIITGYEDGSFRPRNTITRAEVVAMMKRALEKFKPDEFKPTATPTPTTTSTVAPATATAIPPTPTATAIPPTPTATAVPPTATPAP